MFFKALYVTKISLDTVKSLINYLTQCGLDRDSLLHNAKLSEMELNQSGKLINTSVYESLYQHAQFELNSQTIGFEFGKTIEPDRWGVLGYITFLSPTLKETLINHQKYQTLSGNLGTPVQELEKNTINLKWVPAYNCSHHTTEEILTGWYTMAHKLSNHKITPLAIYFSHVCQANLEDYQQYFGCEVYFNSDNNSIKIDKSMLDTPLNRHDREIYELLCKHGNDCINQLVIKSPVEVISQFIRNQLPISVPDIELAAQTLNMSVRTLQRKLSENHITYSSLVDSIRQDLATSYLRNPNISIIQITQMLGFSEQSAFTRAFKRWTNQTPMQFRYKSN